MKLNEFAGNEKVLEQLGNLIEAKRFPHALVIEGERGLGKKTLARLLACALVCRGEDVPCMTCPQCRKVMKNIHPDVKEYIPSGAANSFYVDTVRDIISDAYMKPNEAERKVYILAEANCMNVSAQNALLKILEEPPSYAVFILTAPSKSSLLSTIISRCTAVSLEGVPIAQGADFICKKAGGITYTDAEKALEAFNGNIGKAIESINDERTAQLIEACRNICKSLAGGSEYSLMVSCAVFQKDRQSVIFSCALLKKIFRDALLAGGDCEYISGQQESAMLLKNSLSRQKLVSLYNTCGELEELALMNVNNALLITKICYSLRRAAGR